MRRAAIVVAAVALAGCGSHTPKPGPTPAPTPTATPTALPPSDDELLQQALDRRARHEAPAGLGVRDIRYQLDREVIDGHRAGLSAQMTYGVEGVPGSFGGRIRLRARKHHGVWRVRRRPVGSRGRPPWLADDYRRLATGHFVVWLPDGLDFDGLQPALASGYEQLQANLRRGTLRKRYLVVVARDADHARALTTSIQGLENLTALTDTQVQLVGPTERVTHVGSQRLLVLAPAFGALTPDQQAQTITHELTHAALAPVTSGRVPAWLTEGLAMYVSRDRRAITSPTPTLRALTGPDSIGHLDGVKQTDAYARASAATFLIADRYGRAKLLALYDVFNKASLPGKAGSPRLVDRALRRVLGIGLSELDRDLR